MHAAALHSPGPSPRRSAAQAFFAHWLAQRGELDARYELVHGRVEQSALPDARARELAGRLCRRLARAAFAAHRGAEVLGPACTLELPTGDTLTVDVAVIAGGAPPPSRATGTHGAIVASVASPARAPALVVDVLASSPARRDRAGAIERRSILAAAGVREHWLVDPRSQTITVLALAGDRLGLCGVLRRGQSLDLEPLLGIALPVAAVFYTPPRLVLAPARVS